MQRNDVTCHLVFTIKSSFLKICFYFLTYPRILLSLIHIQMCIRDRSTSTRRKCVHIECVISKLPPSTDCHHRRRKTSSDSTHVNNLNLSACRFVQLRHRLNPSLIIRNKNICRSCIDQTEFQKVLGVCVCVCFTVCIHYHCITVSYTHLDVYKRQVIQ